MSVLQATWQAILARAKQDTGTGGLYAGGAWSIITGMFNTLAPLQQAFPYVVYSVQSAQNVDGLPTAVRELDFSMKVYVSESADALSTLAAITHRIVGDWYLQSNRVPSYGYDRWLPVFSDPHGWAAGQVQHVESLEDHEEGVYGQIERFRMFPSRVGVT